MATNNWYMTGDTRTLLFRIWSLEYQSTIELPACKRVRVQAGFDGSANLLVV